MLEQRLCFVLKSQSENHEHVSGPSRKTVAVHGEGEEEEETGNSRVVTLDLTALAEAAQTQTQRSKMGPGLEKTFQGGDFPGNLQSTCLRPRAAHMRLARLLLSTRPVPHSHQDTDYGKNTVFPLPFPPFK